MRAGEIQLPFIEKIIREATAPALWKEVVLGLLGLMLAGALHSCTNDEGDTEFDTLTPNVEQQQAA